MIYQTSATSMKHARKKYTNVPQVYFQVTVKSVE